MFSKRGILYLIVLGFSAGIVINEIFLVGRWFFLVCISLILTTFLVLVTFNRSFGLICILIISVSIFTGYGRSSLSSFYGRQETALNNFVGQKVLIKGVLTEEQEKREFNTRLTVEVGEVFDPKTDTNQKTPRQEKILVTTTNPRDFKYGDIVSIRGELVRPENFYTDTGREFDYVGYLEASNVRFLIKNASVEFIGNEPPNFILAWLFFAKRAFVHSLSEVLPEPESSLASGILIDGKQSINGELQEKFRKTGLVHIVVLSGYNVSIVAEAIGKAFSFLPRFFGLTGAGLGIVAFALITGASATVVRASIMALLVLFSRMTIRNYDPSRGLFLASLLMLVHNPKILIHSPSFQLSFLATFAVVRIVPIFESRTTWLPERLGLRGLVVSNIIVQLFLFPILTWMTGFVSAVSLPVNLLVLPLIPTTMLSSFLSALFGFFHKILALPFALLSHVLLLYELTVVDFFSKMKIAEIPLGIFSGWTTVFFYVVSIIFILIFQRVR